MEAINKLDNENKPQIHYRVSFWKTGCSYGSCFDTEEERDKFAESIKKSGFHVSVYNSQKGWAVYVYCMGV